MSATNNTPSPALTQAERDEIDREVAATSETRGAVREGANATLWRLYGPRLLASDKWRAQRIVEIEAELERVKGERNGFLVDLRAVSIATERPEPWLQGRMWDTLAHMRRTAARTLASWQARAEKAEAALAKAIPFLSEWSGDLGNLEAHSPRCERGMMNEPYECVCGVSERKRAIDELLATSPTMPKDWIWREDEHGTCHLLDDKDNSRGWYARMGNKATPTHWLWALAGEGPDEVRSVDSWEAADAGILDAILAPSTAPPEPVLPEGWEWFWQPEDEQWLLIDNNQDVVRASVRHTEDGRWKFREYGEWTELEDEVVAKSAALTAALAALDGKGGRE